MKELILRTRAQANPDGKMKVYFCHHPDDFNDCFSDICKDILAISDCAVCYYGGEGEMPDLATQEQNLSHMRLLVMPVTTRLLTEPSRALSYEVPLAKKYRIPILPLMMEEGLEKLFESKLGHMQFLFPGAKDETAIPYEEKLKRYLESRFVSDFTAQRIRKAFDAYIFLSYRKKDRENAQELMKLIHKIDFCRDFAIWYDEFLTPGEDFSESIRKAITDSQFFALTVTPNLFEDGNYVKEKEFPLAKTLDKPILPVEFADTDRAKLKDIYGFDDPVCSKKLPQLAELLLREIEKLAKEKKLKNKKKGPEHSYLMGLAYLNGIDVERDPEKAEALITEAAEANIYDAVKKLANMYLDGDGVERNPQRAIFWLEQLVEMDRCKYEDSGRKNYGEDYCIDLWLLGSVLFDQRLLERARDIFERMLDIAQALVDENETESTYGYLIRSYRHLGDICYELGQKRKTYKYQKKALQVAIAVDRKFNSMQTRTLLADCYSSLANACIYIFRFGKVRRCLKKALALRKIIAEENPSVKSRLTLAEAHNELGEFSAYTAEKHYMEAYRILKALADELDTEQIRSALAMSCQNLGAHYVILGHKETAAEYYQKAYDIRKQILEKENCFTNLYNFSNVCISYGKLLQDSAMLEEAQRIYALLAQQHPELWYVVNRQKWAKHSADKLNRRKKT